MRSATPVFAIVTAWLMLGGQSVVGEGKPNIVIILADDLGYADLGCQGCKDIPTPHIDSIATSGVRFTDGYATHPYCSPSRAGLMSGMYQHRFGFETNSGPELYAAPNFGVPRSVPILAERLKHVGYATGMVGKWHIGFREGLRPHERGFDFFYGFLSGARSYYPDGQYGPSSPILRNGKIVNDETEYLTDAFAREAVEFIDGCGDEPWFLYLAFNAVHTPMEATEEYEARFPGITDRRRRTLAGMLAAMDDAVGRVLAKIRTHGEEEETIVFFYSDNGGIPSKNASFNHPLRGYKGQVFEGGIRVPFLAEWKGTIPSGQVFEEPVMGFDVHATALAAAGVEVAFSHRQQSDDRQRWQDATATLDGVDLLPYLTGETQGRPHERLFWRDSRQHAVRLGDWKLVKPRTGPPALFNLAEDLGEQENLVASQPEKLQELQAAFAEWEKGTMPAQWIRQDRYNAEPGGKLKDNPTGRRAARGSLRIEEAFQNADKNRDGKLTREEYPRPEAFPNVDADGDGFATLEEVRAYFGGRRSRRAPRR
jgi:arylsulfatase A-like enzyme